MRRHQFKDVDPLPGLAPWLGGKTRLAKLLSDRFAAIPHGIYAEPFVGLGAAFFGRRQRPRVEVVNDVNGEITNLFRVARAHPRALIDEIRAHPFGRDEFFHLLRADPAYMTDVQRAARFVYLQRVRFGGKPRDTSFPATKGSAKALSHRALRRRFMALSRRLAQVTIENMPYEEFIPRYDTAKTLFYLDPPYWGSERKYGPGFSRDDFGALAVLLAQIRGRFILSINDVPEIREIFGRFEIDTIEVRYTIHHSANKSASELLVSNTAA